MRTDLYREQFEAATERIASLASGDVQGPVPHIDDWTARDAIIHVGSVFSFVAQSIEQNAPLSDKGVAAWANDQANHPETKQLSGWFKSNSEQLAEVVWSHLPDEEIWTTSHVIKTAAFWMRRMTQEAVMHRWDIEAAHADTNPIDAEMAVDGIDEFYDFFIAERLPDAFAGNGTVHLHATDAAGEWMITRRNDGIEVEKAHGKGDVAARGPASDLLLFVWNRKTHLELETFGDTELLVEHQRLLQV
tara:strand:- start:1733 stop:2473 length:741 start_codon:yes stop_codon:yes gene_type:complete